MKNGDLSNQLLPLVLVRLEDTVLHEQNTKIIDKLANLKLGKINNSKIDVGVVSYVMKLARQTGYSVLLGLDKKQKINLSTFHLTGFDVLPLRDLDHVRNLLESGIIDYYLDENRERISLLSHERALTIDEFRHISGVK